jgi:hypothetical protein
MKTHSHYYPVDTGIPIEISGMEYFGPEQYLEDLETIVNREVNSYQILGNLNGMWEGELDDAVKTATKVMYTDRLEFKDYLYEVKDFNKFPTLNKIPEIMGFEKGKYMSQIQLQRPGCIMSKHYDPVKIFQPWYNEIEKCVRVLIALAPWEYGQLIGFNNEILTGWKQGDIIYCDFPNTWHFTANCSWHSRPLLQVSGVANDELLSLVKTKNYRIFDL